MSSCGEQEESNALERQVIRKITWRIVPILMIGYFMAYIDRVNIGFAALHMNADIGLSAAQFGIASGIFFVGAFFFEIPSNILLEKYGARMWITRIMITWGFVAVLMATAVGPYSLISLRFLLGVAEAGFFPGVILYLSYWLPAAHRARLIGMFMVAIPLSNMLGSPISAALLHLDGFLNLQGWRWMFILEGIPAILMGFVVLCALPDRPDRVSWLTGEEQRWLAARLTAERKPRDADHARSALSIMRNPQVWILTTAVGAGVATNGALSIWQPQLLKQFSLTTMQIGMLNAIPFGIASIAMVLWGLSSDRANERVWHTVMPLVLSALAFGAFSFTSGLIGTLVVLSIGLSATYALKGPVWAFSTEWLSQRQAAVGIALLNCTAGLWASVANYLVGHLRGVTSDFSLSLLPLVLLNLAGAAGVVYLTIKRSKLVTDRVPMPQR